MIYRFAALDRLHSPSKVWGYACGRKTEKFLLGRIGIYLCIYGHVSGPSFFATSACVLSRLRLSAMAFTTFCCLTLLAAFGASAQSTCVTLQPVFELPFDATSTVYGSTITSTSSVDCGGCSLVVSTFRAVITTPVSNLLTSTHPTTN